MSQRDELQLAYQNLNSVMEETGHESMLARVKATHRMVNGLVDQWEAWCETGQESGMQPSWLTSKADVDFFDMMVRKFDIAKMEDIVINKKQYWWVRDIWERSL